MSIYRHYYDFLENVNNFRNPKKVRVKVTQSMNFPLVFLKQTTKLNCRQNKTTKLIVLRTCVLILMFQDPLLCSL